MTNWAAVLAILTASGVLSGGVGAALVQGVFRRVDPETKAKAADIIADAGAALAKQYMDSNAELSKSNAALRKSNDQLAVANRELSIEIHGLREALVAVLDAIDIVKPSLPVENGRLAALDRALHTARERAAVG